MTADEIMRYNIRFLRKNYDLTLEELADRSRIDQHILEAMENNEPFRIEYFFDLCDYYRITPYRMFGPIVNLLN